MSRIPSNCLSKRTNSTCAQPFTVVVPQPNQMGLSHVVTHMNIPVASLQNDSTTQEWALLAVYSVLHLGDSLDDRLASFGGRFPDNEAASNLAFQLPWGRGPHGCP